MPIPAHVRVAVRRAGNQIDRAQEPQAYEADRDEVLHRMRGTFEDDRDGTIYDAPPPQQPHGRDQRYLIDPDQRPDWMLDF